MSETHLPATSPALSITVIKIRPPRAAEITAESSIPSSVTVSVVMVVIGAENGGRNPRPNRRSAIIISDDSYGWCRLVTVTTVIRRVITITASVVASVIRHISSAPGY